MPLPPFTATEMLAQQDLARQLVARALMDAMYQKVHSTAMAAAFKWAVEEASADEMVTYAERVAKPWERALW